MNPFAKAHEILADLLASGEAITAETVGVARSEEHGLQVIVTLAPYQPLRLDPESAAALKARIAALGQPEPATAAPAGLREIEATILEAAPVGEPVNRAELAERAGYYCGPYFRKAVNDLIEKGLLIEDRRTRKVKRA